MSLLVVLAFAVLALYAHPGEDDYSFSVECMDKGFWGAQAHFYTTWSGRFASNMLTLLFYTITSLRCYAAGPLLILVMLWLAFYATSRAVLRESGGNRLAAGVATGLAAVCLVTMPQVQGGIYWFNAAAIYTVGVCLAMILVAWMAQRRAALSLPAATGAFALAVATAGYNEVLVGPVMVALLIGLAMTRRIRWALCIAGVVAGAAVAFPASGNFVRQGAYGGSPHGADVMATVWTVLGQSIATAGRCWLTWLSQGVFLAGCALWLLVSALVVRQSKLRPRVHFLAPTLLVGFIVTVLALAPVIYTLTPGTPVHPRVLNVGFMIFFLSWFICLWFCGGVLAKTRLPLAPLSVAAAAMLAVSVGLSSRGKDVVVDVSGRAGEFDREMVARDQLARREARRPEARLELPPIKTTQSLLFLSDMYPYRSAWQNRVYARFWGIQSVRVLDPQATMTDHGRVQAVPSTPSAGG